LATRGHPGKKREPSKPQTQAWVGPVVINEKL